MTAPTPGHPEIRQNILKFIPVETNQVIEGQPATSTTVIGTRRGPVELGVWVITEGTVRDIEIAETFVVLSGRALLTINNGAAIPIAAGSIVTFEAGDETIWQVLETLQKFYVCSAVEQR